MGTKRQQEIAEQERRDLRETFTAQVERDKGRPATPAELRAVEVAVKAVQATPRYSGG